MSWKLVYTKRAQKDAQKLAAVGLKPNAKLLLYHLTDNPFKNPPPYQIHIVDLAGGYSRRINIQYRLVYQVLEDNGTVKVLACGRITQ